MIIVTLNKKQALKDSLEHRNNLYFPTDLDCIIVLGKVYGVSTNYKEHTLKVDSKIISDIYKTILPWCVVDGINDAGVSINANVVPVNEKINGKINVTTGTNKGKKRMSAIMLIRYLLDNADSALHAVELILNLDIWCPHKGFIEEFHYMISDKNECYIVEFINNETVILKTTPDVKGRYHSNIMTNFYLGAYPRKEGNDSTSFLHTLHPAGTERYDILNSIYNNITDDNIMLYTMQQVLYTKAYSEKWYSELCAEYPSGTDITYEKILNPEEYPEVDRTFLIFKKLHEERQRTPDNPSWQTVHTSIMNNNNKTLTLYCQEDYTNKYQFTVGDTFEDGINKLNDYIWTTNCNEYDEVDITKFINTHFACSSVYKDGIHGRNLDWNYNDNAEFVVNVPAIEGKRHASIGISSVMPMFTELSAEDYPNYYGDAIINETLSLEVNLTSSTNLTLTATPKNNRTFVKWSDGSTDNPHSITSSKDKTISAIFE